MIRTVVTGVAGRMGSSIVRFVRDADDLLPQVNLAAPCLDAAAHLLPHLARPQLGVPEARDERGLAPVLLLAKVARQEVVNRVRHRALER